MTDTPQLLDAAYWWYTRGRSCDPTFLVEYVWTNITHLKIVLYWTGKNHPYNYSHFRLNICVALEAAQPRTFPTECCRAFSPMPLLGASTGQAGRGSKLGLCTSNIAIAIKGKHKYTWGQSTCICDILQNIWYFNCGQLTYSRFSSHAFIGSHIHCVDGFHSVQYIHFIV